MRSLRTLPFALLLLLPLAGGFTPPAHAADTDVTALFTTSPSVTLPPALAGVVPGMARDEAIKRIPSLAKSGAVALAPGNWAMVNFDEAKLHVDRISVTVAGDAQAALTKAWGAPNLDPDPVEGAGTARWWNPAAHLRATLRPAQPDMKGRVLDVVAYAPVEELLGANGPDFAFLQGKPLLGQTMDQVAAAFPDVLMVEFSDAQGQHQARWRDVQATHALAEGDQVYLELPRCEDGRWPTRVGLTLEEGKVKSFDIGLTYTGAGRDRLVALLEKKIGAKSTPVAGYDGLYLLREAPRMTWKDREGYLRVEIGGRH